MAASARSWPMLPSRLAMSSVVLEAELGGVTHPSEFLYGDLAIVSDMRASLKH